jgi:hypothetical protein
MFGKTQSVSSAFRRCVEILIEGIRGPRPLTGGASSLRELADKEAAAYRELLARLNGFVLAAAAIPQAGYETPSGEIDGDFLTALRAYEDLVVRNGRSLDFRLRPICRAVLSLGRRLRFAQCRERQLRSQTARAGSEASRAALDSKLRRLTAEQMSCTEQMQSLERRIRALVLERSGITLGV